MTVIADIQSRWVCATCAYDLTVPTADRCPECGSLVAAVRVLEDPVLIRLGKRATLTYLLGFLVMVCYPAWAASSRTATVGGAIFAGWFVLAALGALFPWWGPHRFYRQFLFLGGVSTLCFVAMGAVSAVAAVFANPLALANSLPLLAAAGLLVRFIVRYRARYRWCHEANAGEDEG